MQTRTFFQQVWAELGVGDIKVVDVGANPLTEQKPPYQVLLDRGLGALVAFEPDPEAFAQLRAGPRERYLPAAVGDGRRHKLRVCAMNGMNSLLEPNFRLLNLTNLHAEWAEVKETVDVDTLRLDDVQEVEAIDYLKIDIQGGELMVFENARQKLADCLVVHTEAMLVPMYVDQPLFADQELELRRHGLRLHKFADTASHALHPFCPNGDPHAGLSQLFWVDAVFIKDLLHPAKLTPAQLVKLAAILHEVYWSVDVAHHFLRCFDHRMGASWAPRYIEFLRHPPASDDGERPVAGEGVDRVPAG